MVIPFALAAFMADDLIQMGVLERVLPSDWIGPLDLYSLSDGVPAHVRTMQNAGACPWFFGPDFKMTFFRPLTSGLIALDHAVWGLRPAGYRLHGVLWLLVLVAGCGLVLRRTMRRQIGP